MNCVDSFWNETALNARTCLNVSGCWGGMGLVDQGPVQWSPSWTSLNMLRRSCTEGGGGWKHLHGSSVNRQTDKHIPENITFAIFFLGQKKHCSSIPILSFNDIKRRRRNITERLPGCGIGPQCWSQSDVCTTNPCRRIPHQTLTTTVTMETTQTHTRRSRALCR